MVVVSAYPALDVLFTTPKCVFEEGIEDATESKGGLDDVGGEFANCVVTGQRADSQDQKRTILLKRLALDSQVFRGQGDLFSFDRDRG